jgi:hypothetical protein
LDIYQNNLVALSSVDKELAGKLHNISSNELFEVFLAENDSLEQLQIIDNRDKSVMHDSPNEIVHKLKMFEEYDNYHSLYFFGIGSGVFFEKLLKNQNHKKIYIFEPEIELIYIALNLIDFSYEILNKRVVIKHSASFNIYQAKRNISKDSSLYLKKYNLDIYSNYYEKYIDEIKRINSVILLFFKHILDDKGDSLDDTLVGYKYSTNRMLYMFEQPSISKVLNALKGKKHAVMVSTGPSLEKQLPLLKQYQDYFTILCVDASFPILYREGIRPDIVLAMERVPEVAKFFIDIPPKFYKGVIFMLATVCHDEVFDSIQEEGIICPYLRADTHNISLGLDEWGYLGGGLCGANYLFNFAMNVDFENFVFIGQDLAFSKDGFSHAEGHVFGKDGEEFDKTFDGYITAYGGHDEVATQKYWRIFLNDFVVQIAYLKEYKNMKVYNATEGGARIVGTIEVPFKTYCETILDISVSKELICVEYPSKEEIKRSKTLYFDKQNANLLLAKSVKKQARKCFDVVEKFLNKIQDMSDDIVLSEINDKELDNILDKIYLVREKYGEPKFINSFSTLFMSYLSHLDFDVAAVKTMRENTVHAIKLKKLNYIKVNYEWLYRLWASLDRIIEILESSLKRK